LDWLNLPQSGSHMHHPEGVEHIITAWDPSNPLELNIKVDAGRLQSRRIIEKMLAAEPGWKLDNRPNYTMRQHRDRCG
jgi:hypothetical protein